jgi:hypothetical protein
MTAEVVRDGRWLRRLRVGVHREDSLAMPLGQVDQGPPQRDRALDQAEDAVALAHPVQRHVDVVAAARRVEAAGDVGAAGLLDDALGVEKQILVGAVVDDRADVVFVDGVERRPDGVRIVARDDALVGEHHQVRVMHRDHRREQELLGVFEVVVEDVPDIFRRESHKT